MCLRDLVSGGRTPTVRFSRFAVVGGLCAALSNTAVIVLVRYGYGSVVATLLAFGQFCSSAMRCIRSSRLIESLHGLPSQVRSRNSCESSDLDGCPLCIQRCFKGLHRDRRSGRDLADIPVELYVGEMGFHCGTRNGSGTAPERLPGELKRLTQWRG